jgi:hypothetical protein
MSSGLAPDFSAALNCAVFALGALSSSDCICSSNFPASPTDDRVGLYQPLIAGAKDFYESFAYFVQHRYKSPSMKRIYELLLCKYPRVGVKYQGSKVETILDRKRHKR